MAKMMNPTKVVTGVCRFSYANLWEPKAMDENSKAKYSVSLIIPKSDTKTLDKIRAAIQAAYEEGKNKLSNGKSVPPLTALKTPLRDGDLERPDDEAYANSYFVNASHGGEICRGYFYARRYWYDCKRILKSDSAFEF